MEDNTKNEEKTKENEQLEATDVGAFFRNKWKAVAGRFGKSRKSEKETQAKINRQFNSAEMIATFNSRWETVVELVVRLTGLGKGAARNALLVAIVPLLTTVVQMANWAYLYMHYYLGYNVPVAYLTIDTSWLVSLGIGVLLVAIFFGAFVYLPNVRGICHSALLLVFYLFVFLLFSSAHGPEYLRMVICGFMWFPFIEGISVLLTTKKHEKKLATKGKAIFYATVVLDTLGVVLTCLWWIKPFLSKWGIDQWISIDLWYIIAICTNVAICGWGIVVYRFFKPPKQSFFYVRFQICLTFLLTIVAFFTIDNYMIRVGTYAVLADSQQVVVYQSKEISVLEAATIAVDEETGNVTLTIDASQQQIVDSTSLSYEYQSFDTVEIIKTKSDSQDSADDSSISDNAESSVVADIDIDPADTSTDPADGAVSYDTSN